MIWIIFHITKMTFHRFMLFSLIFILASTYLGNLKQRYILKPPITLETPPSHFLETNSNHFRHKKEVSPQHLKLFRTVPKVGLYLFSRSKTTIHFKTPNNSGDPPFTLFCNRIWMDFQLLWTGSHPTFGWFHHFPQPDLMEFHQMQPDFMQFHQI